MNNTAHCSACGGTPDNPPIQFRVPEPIRREPRKALIDPLFYREWLKGTAGTTLGLGALVFLGPTIIIPMSLDKPIDFDVVTILALIATLIQCTASLGVILEWGFLTKKVYLGVLTGAFVASLLLGFGDLANTVIYGFAGGFMLFVRILNTVVLGVALFAGNAVKQIPID